MRKRRFNSSDFNNNNGIDKDDVIVDMNDIKIMFREWLMVKMEEDFEKMVRKYLKDKLL
jgi:hypothetical protein|tara:strand:- start:579 stop:755 length:177 start_codon:yes stop_codon:yes gene_type:complete